MIGERARISKESYIDDSCKVDHFREFCFHRGTNRRMISDREGFIRKATAEFQGNAVNIGCFLIKPVKAFFEVDVLEDEKAGSQAKSQAKYVEERVYFVFKNVPESDFEVVGEHEKVVLRNPVTQLP